MIPMFEYGGRGWTPLGLPMSQNRLAVPTWSFAMEKHPPVNIVEIGTNNGGFTIALGIHAWAIKAQIHTFDITQAPNEDFLPLAAVLPISFHKLDCFSEKGEKLIREIIQRPGTTYLLCDGGDKPKEFNHFAEFMKPGDVIAAHDYSVKEEWWPWREVKLCQVQDAIMRHDLSPFMQEHFDMAAWLAYKKN